MSATRTQVYLRDDQRQRIDRAAKAQGVTMAELIRRAVDTYLADELDPSTALSSTFGAQPDLTVPSRDEWDRA